MWGRLASWRRMARFGALAADEAESDDQESYTHQD
jgi:hypothetical protein